MYIFDKKSLDKILRFWSFFRGHEYLNCLSIENVLINKNTKIVSVPGNDWFDIISFIKRMNSDIDAVRVPVNAFSFDNLSMNNSWSCDGSVNMNVSLESTGNCFSVIEWEEEHLGDSSLSSFNVCSR